MSQTDKRSSPASSQLVELSNAMVALHREHFGRGPAAAKSIVTEGMAICVLTDVYTRVERRLIAAGQGEHVRMTRVLHQEVCEAEYCQAVERILGQRVAARMSSVHISPDLAVETFLLDDKRASGTGEAERSNDGLLAEAGGPVGEAEDVG